MIVTLDFESASSVPLDDAGAYRYWEDATTEILCLVAQSDTEVQATWTPQMGTECPAADQLRAWAADDDVVFEAHNAQFEIEAWRRQMVGLYGFPVVPNERWRCTMAAAAYRAVPLRLDSVLAWLEVGKGKDMVGSRLTRALSAPKRGRYDRTDATLQRVIAYCESDVVNERALARAVGALPPEEQAVWALDLQINQRGVALDVPFIHAARRLVENALVPMAAEFEDLTGLRPSQRDAVLQWMRANGAALPNLQGATIRAVLGGSFFAEEDEDDDSPGDLPEPIEVSPRARRALELRQVVSSASVKKYDAMLASLGADWRARGLLQYHAATTGRWGGRLWQPQNLPRPVVNADPAVLVAAVMAGDVSALGQPIAVAVSGCRHAIVPARGKMLLAGDFASIEACVDLALAGQHDKCAMIAAGADVYCDMAALIYGRPITKADAAERFIGKQAVLGCGFQMGWAKFQARCAPDHPEEFCRHVIDTYRQEWAPLVPALWRDLEEAALTAVWSAGDPVTANCGVEYQRGAHWLRARLPSGRCIWYFDPQPAHKTLPWAPDEKRPAWSYSAMRKGQRQTIYAYGGLLTENVVQALARDLLVHAMCTMDREGLDIVLTIHDEILVEGTADQLSAFTQIMQTAPAWASAMRVPVRAECHAMERYQK